MKLNFRKVGEGKPVIILHGLFGSSDNWQTFGKQLAANGYSVYLVDLRNHGLSPHSDDFNYDALAGDILELFNSEQLDTAFLIGHSLGGKTAMTFAYRNPEKIKGLIVVDIAPRQYPVQHRDVLDALLSVDINNIHTRREAETVLTSSLNQQATIQFLLKNLYWKQKDRLAWRFNLDIINKQIETVGQATAPAVPFKVATLFVKGEKSGYITYDDEREIYDLFENAEVITVPGAGHWVHADNPHELLAIVNEFLSNLN